MELFDTTELRQTATLARYVETAAAAGQPDLFTETTDGNADAATVDAVEDAATVTVYLAASQNGANVYLPGVICAKCDPTYDPHFRNGVPCVDPYGHAAVTVSNWRFNGSTDAEVVMVEVPVGDPAEMVKTARCKAEAALAAAFAWPAPVGALFTREDATGEMILS